MGITANSGPFISYGITTGSSGNVSEYNEERAPSVFDLGQATQDPRNQFFGWTPGQAVGPGALQVRALWDQQGVVDFIPFAGSSGSSAILVSSASGAPVAGTALTLAPISSQGAFTTTIIAPESGKSVSVIAIDSTAQTLSFGTAGTIGIWNPAAGTGRNIMIINTSNANSEQYIVRGRDMYGFKMTETVLASTTSTGTQGLKAFKYVVSVTPSTATTISATGVSVGFGDKYGMPLYAPYSAGITVYNSTTPNGSGAAVALSSVNFTAASTVVTATTTTGDVRGTYNSSIATLGTTANGAGGYNPTSTGIRITIYQPVTPNMAAAINLTSNTSAWFGVTQFSDFSQ